jgi:hypothetical protein
MSIDERKRHARYERLEDVLDGEHADTLMELLPPVGWADVATKQDLAALEQRMDLRFEAMEHRFEAQDHRFDARLTALGSELRGEMAELDKRLTGQIAALRDELHAALRTQTWSILGVLLVALVVSEVVSRVA